MLTDFPKNVTKVFNIFQIRKRKKDYSTKLYKSQYRKCCSLISLSVPLVTDSIDSNNNYLLSLSLLLRTFSTSLWRINWNLLYYWTTKFTRASYFKSVWSNQSKMMMKKLILLLSKCGDFFTLQKTCISSSLNHSA